MGIFLLYYIQLGCEADLTVDDEVAIKYDLLQPRTARHPPPDPGDPVLRQVQLQERGAPLQAVDGGQAVVAQVQESQPR